MLNVLNAKFCNWVNTLWSLIVPFYHFFSHKQFGFPNLRRSIINVTHSDFVKNTLCYFLDSNYSTEGALNLPGKQGQWLIVKIYGIPSLPSEYFRHLRKFNPWGKHKQAAWNIHTVTYLICKKILPPSCQAVQKSKCISPPNSQKPQQCLTGLKDKHISWLQHSKIPSVKWQNCILLGLISEAVSTNWINKSHRKWQMTTSKF